MKQVAPCQVPDSLGPPPGSKGPQSPQPSPLSCLGSSSLHLFKDLSLPSAPRQWAVNVAEGLGAMVVLQFKGKGGGRGAVTE